MPGDTIDFLFDWQEEDREAAQTLDDTEETPNTRKWGEGRRRKPWPPREITEEERATGQTRKCRVCGVVYPQMDEFFERNTRGYMHRRCQGCRRRESRVYSANRKDQNKWLTRRWRSIRTGARKRNIEWAFTDPEVLRKFYDTPCHYCGGEVEACLGLDRVDNDKGYVAGNVVQCCAMCNRMKSSHSVDEWTAHMERVLNHLQAGQEPPDETS